MAATLLSLPWLGFFSFEDKTGKPASIHRSSSASILFIIDGRPGAAVACTRGGQIERSESRGIATRIKRGGPSTPLNDIARPYGFLTYNPSPTVCITTV